MMGTSLKFITSEKPTNVLAIAICIHGFVTEKGNPPTKEELLESLTISGTPISREQLNARLSDLRKKKWIREKALILTVKGRKEIEKKYSLA